jgi:hypothetical protein
MTIPVRKSSAPGQGRAAQLPDYFFLSDRTFRVPPTGIPKPDPGEVPPALRWRDRLAGFACAVMMSFGVGSMANAS